MNLFNLSLMKPGSEKTTNSVAIVEILVKRYFDHNQNQSEAHTYRLKYNAFLLTHS